MKPFLRLSAVLLLSAFGCAACAEAPSDSVPTVESLRPTQAERDARLGWWREARFGMFVHWGPSSLLGNVWKGHQYGGYGEHIQRQAKIPIPVYRREVVGAFNPTKFNADEWVRLAKEAGMGYFVITAKHHDGFAMYDSDVSDYNVVKATPFKRDPMRELRDACRRQGVKFGFYYSHAFDWGEENGPGNDWDFNNPGGDRQLCGGREWWKSEEGEAFLPKARRYVDGKSIPQLRELIAKYDPDILWFDTPHKLPPEENLRILEAVRKAGPRVVVNGRLVHNPQLGDYESTWDRPADFPTFDPKYSGDWEGVPTTNGSYGYAPNDRSHKSVTHFCRLLAKSVARGGNQLMNVGPKGDGEIDAPDVAILRGIADWWRANGESIRGCGRTPLSVQAWGESTLGKNNRLYLHVFDWPKDGRLVVGGLKTPVKSARLLSAPGATLPVAKLPSGDLAITVPVVCPDARDAVIALDCDGPPAGDREVRLLAANVGANVLRTLDARLSGKAEYGPGRTEDDYVQHLVTPGDALHWPVRINAPAKFRVAIGYDAPGTGKARLVAGDAGSERVAATQGAGGVYRVTLGDKTFSAKVRNGVMVSEELGEVTLEPGVKEIRISPESVSGEELFRPRELTLTPVTE